MANGIGLHILFDRVNTAFAVGELVDTLDDLQPAVINIVGAARMTQAFEFAQAMRSRYPQMRVIFRAWPDDGNHAKSIYADPAEWVRVMSPFMRAGLTVLTDNESSASDYGKYVKWSCDVMNICGLAGWSVAVGRQSTGNPGDGTGGSTYQYDQFHDLLTTLAAWGDLHTYSPNEYVSNRTLPRASSGHTARFLHMWDYASSRSIRIPLTSIGEWGMAMQRDDGSLDAGRGFHHSQLQGKDYANALVDFWKTYYAPHNVPVSLYAYGDSLGGEWDSFRIDTDKGAITQLRTLAKTGTLALAPIARPPIVVTPPTPTPTPPPSEGGEDEYAWHAVIPGTYVNVRTAPWLGAPVATRLAPTTKFKPTGEKSTDSSLNVWYRILTPTGCGWVSSQGPEDKPRVRFIKE